MLWGRGPRRLGLPTRSASRQDGWTAPAPHRAGVECNVRSCRTATASPPPGHSLPPHVGVEVGGEAILGIIGQGHHLVVCMRKAENLGVELQ